MPARRTRSTKPSERDSDSEDGAPEAISLSTSKKAARQESATQSAAQAAARQRLKEKNRERDRKLKERAAETRPPKELGDGGSRKRRNVEEADKDTDEESDEDAEGKDTGEGSDGDAGDHEKLGEYGTFAGELDTEMSGDSDDDEHAGNFSPFDATDSESDGSDVEETIQPRSKAAMHHLPDHLFTSAFAAQASTPSQAASSSSTKAAAVVTRKASKRARSGKKPKDIVVGSRIFRPISTESRAPSGAGTIPSRKVRKFLDRSLGLKGGRPHRLGSQRRPAHLGILKSNGPPARFVRNAP